MKVFKKLGTLFLCVSVVLIIFFVFIGCENVVMGSEEEAIKEAAEEEEAPEEVEEETAEKPITIGVSYSELEVEFFKLYQKGMKAKAEELGIELIEADSQADPERQSNNIAGILAQDVDAIIIIAHDETTVVPEIEKANELGIPVFALDKKPTGGEYYHLSAGHEQIGIIQAEFIAECIGNKGQVAYIMGLNGQSYCEMLQESADEVFSNYPEIEVVYREYTDWDREKGLLKTEDLLTVYPDINGIIYHSDFLCMSGLEAIKAADKLDQISLIGGDADYDMLQAIKRGEVEGTVDPRPVESGIIAMDAVYQLATKGDITESIEYVDGPVEIIDGHPTLSLKVNLITKDNVNDTLAYGEIED